jgi:type IV pilus assembly protein PilE
MLLKQAGLTLVELMVVVAVMAVIASIAYPLYTNQVQKTRRADAKIALQNIALAQERYFTINGEYAGTLSSLQVSADIQGGASDEGYYTISLARSGTDNEQFTATANASSSGAQASDGGCAQFTINQQGVKGATSANCW